MRREGLLNIKNNEKLSRASVRAIALVDEWLQYWRNRIVAYSAATYGRYTSSEVTGKDEFQAFASMNGTGQKKTGQNLNRSIRHLKNLHAGDTTCPAYSLPYYLQVLAFYDETPDCIYSFV